MIGEIKCKKENTDTTKKVCQFEKLTPKTDIDISVYEQALDFIFDNNDIKNVGLTGSYGSGKSTVIETYKAKNPKKNFINISLANFRTTNEERERIKESVLEGKIINQLIHQIPYKKIPQTKFKVKKDENQELTQLRDWLLPMLMNGQATV